jgi:hypothetical protein
MRFIDHQRVLVISHFEQHHSIHLAVILNPQQLGTLKLNNDVYQGVDLLTGTQQTLIVKDQQGVMELSLEPMQSVVIQL